MPYGPVKYDDLCTLVREQCGASGVVLIIIDGEKGNGFSVQADIHTLANLPGTLESVAQQIRASGN